MNLLIQINSLAWRQLNEQLLEKAGESLSEQERAAVTAFLELAEPHVELTQIEMMRERICEGAYDINAMTWEEAKGEI